jgi:hypothetical protein
MSESIPYPASDYVLKLWQCCANLLETIHLIILIRLDHQVPFPKQNYGMAFKIIKNVLKKKTMLPKLIYEMMLELDDKISRMDYYTRHIGLWKRMYKSLMTTFAQRREQLLGMFHGQYLDHSYQTVIEELLTGTQAIRLQLELMHQHPEMERVD